MLTPKGVQQLDIHDELPRACIHVLMLAKYCMGMLRKRYVENVPHWLGTQMVLIWGALYTTCC